jgi:hypothetical protein
MDPEKTRALVDEALKSQTLGMALLALRAVREHELCPRGTLEKLELLTGLSAVSNGPLPEGKMMASKYNGFCSDCGEPYAEGETVFWRGPGQGVLCRGCRVAETAPSVRRPR